MARSSMLRRMDSGDVRKPGEERAAGGRRRVLAILGLPPLRSSPQPPKGGIRGESGRKAVQREAADTARLA
jgi:hypothetical protein